MMNTQQLHSIAKKLEGVASHANIISIKAAIEAAHLGSNGRASHVIADEIHRLAEIAMEASREIERELEGER
jgi:methyl-accepting chemotaxis protein